MAIEKELTGIFEEEFGNRLGPEQLRKNYDEMVQSLTQAERALGVSVLTITPSRDRGARHFQFRDNIYIIQTNGLMTRNNPKVRQQAQEIEPEEFSEAYMGAIRQQIAEAQPGHERIAAFKEFLRLVGSHDF
jgi:hypothetical protein